jgi:hypothetical protein
LCLLGSPRPWKEPRLTLLLWHCDRNEEPSILQDPAPTCALRARVRRVLGA